jgi:hypothetical protein
MVLIDGSMGWIVWPLLFVGLFSIGRGRRGRKRPRGQRGRWDLASPWGSESGVDPDSLLRELEAQRRQLEEMATRVAELENRADFAERLLAGPREQTGADSPG